MRGAQREEVRGVAERDLEPARGLPQPPVRAHVQLVAVEVGAAEHADASAERLRVVARRLQRLPGALQEDALLRVEDGRLARRQPEEAGVEHLHVGEHAARADVARVAQRGGGDPGGQQLVVAEPGDAVDAASQVAPELVEVAGAGEAPTHPHDGDRHPVVAGLLSTRGPVSRPDSRSGGGGRRRAAARVQERRERGERRVLEQLRDGHLGAQPLPEARVHPHQQQRVAAQVEEVVVRRHLLDAEHVGPHAGEGALGGGAWRTAGGADRGLRRGERRAVDLAVRGKRQRRQHDERGGHHVRREAGPQVLPQPVRRRGAGEVGDQAPFAGGVLARHHHALPDAGVREQRGLDLAGLDADAAHLDLLVHAAEELQVAGSQPAHAVARVVQARAGLAGERVRTEALGRQPRPPQVAARHPRPADPQLARHADGHRLHAPPQHVQPRAPRRSADGKALPARAVLPRLQPEGGGVHGRLGDAVHVDQRDARRGPLRQPLARDPLAADHDEAHARRHAPAGARQVPHPLVPVRRRQVEPGDAVPRDGLQQLAGRRHPLGGEDDGGAAAPRGEQLLHYDVEAWRSQLEHPVGRLDVQPLGSVHGERNDGAVLDGDALRGAGGAGGVDDVGEVVGVDRNPAGVLGGAPTRLA